MAVIERDGLAVDFIDEGAGPPIVLAHSSATGNRQWGKLIERMQGRHRVVAPNLHGYGATSPWVEDGTYTLEHAASVLTTVCEYLDARVMLVGHSWGGAAAMAAANVLGERVTDLVVYEPMLPALLREHERWDGWAEGESLFADVKRLGGAQEWEALAQRFIDYFNGDGSWQSVPENRRSSIAASLKPNYYEWDAAMKRRHVSDFAGVTARTLLVRGSETRLLLREVTEVLHSAHPQWELREVAGAGHMAPLTHSDVFNDIVEGVVDSRNM